MLTKLAIRFLGVEGPKRLVTSWPTLGLGHIYRQSRPPGGTSRCLHLWCAFLTLFSLPRRQLGFFSFGSARYEERTIPSKRSDFYPFFIRKIGFFVLVAFCFVSLGSLINITRSAVLAYVGWLPLPLLFVG